MTAMHAMQSGVAMEMNYDAKNTEPKFLRVGVNSALVDSGAMAALLISKGIITKDEYEEKLAEYAEREAKMYEDRIREHFNNANIHLR